MRSSLAWFSMLSSMLLVLSSMLLSRCMLWPCTEIGCWGGYKVVFTGSTAAPGHYRIGVVADGAESSCEITLPRACDTQATCSQGSPTWGVLLEPCVLDGGGTNIEELEFSGQPSSLEVVVRRDDVVVAEGKVRPEYYETHPNGDGCGTCRTASWYMMAIEP